ncbi:MAG: AsmA family protein [Deltaproteobacteria bacterium]|nr:AsmA family protein [Deltaproteobacteria bacterium]MBW2018049.1 AsmA family protein [Deltaproteobacteria bacterium]
MIKTLKWMGIIIGGLIVLLILILLVAPVFIDIQKYKPRIEQGVAKATGRSFSIGGDLDLSLFPWAGISLTDLRMGNPEGFKEGDFLTIKSFDIRVKLLPLLFKDIQIKRFIINGPKLFLERRKDGRANWEGIGKGKGTPSPGGEERQKKGPEGPVEGLPIKGLAVGKFSVSDGELLWVDRASGGLHEIKELALELKDVSLDRPLGLSFSAIADGKPISIKGKLGPLGKEPGKGLLSLDLVVQALEELDMTLKGTVRDAVAERPQLDLALQIRPFSPRKLAAALGEAFPVNTRDPEALNSIGLSMLVKGDPRNLSISDGNLSLDQSKIVFSANVRDLSRPDLQFTVSIDKIDVDRYLPSQGDGTGGGEKKALPQGKGREKTDYGPLRRLVLDGEIRIGELKIKGATLKNVRIKVKGRNGLYTVDPFTFKAYQGNMVSKASLDVRGDVPRTRLKLEGRDFQVRPLLSDVLGKDFLEGTTHAVLDLSMVGDKADQIKRTLKGKGNLRFMNGAIVGVDLSGMVQNIKAAFGFAKRDRNTPRTDFSELEIPFEMNGGVAKTPRARLVSPLLRVLAIGKADLVRETLDFRVEPKVVATIKGQGDTRKRSGIMVPIRIKGSFSKPSFVPDLGGSLKKTLEGGIQQMLEGKGQEGKQAESPEETIKGIFKSFGIQQ